MVLLEGIELSTSPLPRECSTTELQQRRAAPLVLSAGVGFLAVWIGRCNPGEGVGGGSWRRVATKRLSLGAGIGRRGVRQSDVNPKTETDDDP
jgi:hypothetical protein